MSPRDGAIAGRTEAVSTTGMATTKRKPQAARGKTSKASKRGGAKAPPVKAKGKAPPARSAAKAPAKRKAAPAKAAAKAPAKRGAKAAGEMLQKIAFTMFHVVDARRARAFYEDVLGLTRGLASATGTWTEYDLPGGGCLALFSHPDPRFARPPGGASVAFEVADLDALNARLKAAGVSYQGDVVHGPNCRMSNILDSEGNAIILHQLNHG